MSSICKQITIRLIVLFLMYGCSPAQNIYPERRGDFWPSSICKNCHIDIFKQYSDSMHAKSFSNAVFQAQYFNEVIRHAAVDQRLYKEAQACISCHSPIAEMDIDSYIYSSEQIDQVISGVTCDFCHTIWGHYGENPGNANYRAIPGTTKLGPFRHETSWHHVYSEFHIKSEFCALCHNRTNTLGLEIMSTFSEWKNSSYAEDGIQCQDCHMNVMGFLNNGKPIYQSGKAAVMTVGVSPERDRLYTHRFPGAHSGTQVAGALTLEIDLDSSEIAVGDEMTIDVHVNNSRSGHKMPTGSTELRMLLLYVEARTDETTFLLPADAAEAGVAYDITGGGELDKKILGQNIPEGIRVYRVIYIDKHGDQTLASYRAFRAIFDNRLDASEIRNERYYFIVPEGVSEIEIVASLYYVPYPSAFAKKLNLPEAKAVEIAYARKVTRFTKK